jgi:hypothetical protein
MSASSSRAPGLALAALAAFAAFSSPALLADNRSRLDRPAATAAEPPPPARLVTVPEPGSQPAPPYIEPRRYVLKYEDLAQERLEWLGGLAAEQSWEPPLTDPLAPPAEPPPEPVVVPAPPPPPAPAAEQAPLAPPAPPAPPAPKTSLSVELPLRRLIGAETSPAFTRSWAVDWPVSHRLQVARVRLRLVYAVSGFSAPVPGVITIGLNRTVIGQVAINPDQPFNLAELELPVGSVQPGANRIEFLLSVATPPSARAPGQNEPFLQIDANQSVIQIDGDLRELNPRLVQLRDLVRDFPATPYAFHLALPSTEKAFDDDALRAGALVTQAVAVNLRDQPFTVTHGARLRRGVDNIVVGVNELLLPFRQAVSVESIDDAHIAIRPLPGDPRHFVMLVGGPRADDVLRAAGALARAEFALPATQLVRVGRLPRGVMPSGQDQRLVAPGSTVALGELGLEPVTLSAERERVSLPFYLPGDFQPAARDTALLRVDLAQATPAGASPALKVYVNGLFAGALTEQDTVPEALASRAMNAPASLLKPGRNELSLELAAPASARAGSDPRAFPLTLLQTSSLSVPATVGAIELPDLRRFSQSLYPFPATPDGGDLAFHLTDGDPRSIVAAWTLLGRMAQVAGGVLSETQLSFNPVTEDRNLVVVGLFPQIPAALRDASPLRPLPDGRVVFRAPSPRAAPAERVLKLDWVDRLLGRSAAPASSAEQNSAPGEDLEIGLNGQLYEGVFLVQFRAPAHEKRAVLLFTGSSAGYLQAGASSLLDPEVWDRLRGGLAFWQPDSPASLVTIRPTAAFLHGDPPPPPPENPLRDKRTWIILGAILLGLVLLGLLIRVLLGLRKHPHASLDDL